MKNQILSSTTIIILIISLVSEVFDLHTLSLITFLLAFIPIILEYFSSNESDESEYYDKSEVDQMNLEELENYQMELEFDLVEIRQMIREKKA